MRIVSRSILGVCLATLLSTANAGEFYIGGGYGKVNTPIGAGNATTGYVTPSRWGIGGKLFAGYQFSDYIASELTYFQTGSIAAGSNDSGKLNLYALSLTAVGLLPVNQQFRLGADAGIYRDDFRLRGLSGTSYPDGINHNPNATTGLAYGLFAEYMVVQNAYLRAGYDQLLGRSSGTAMRINPKFYTLSLAINLGNGDSGDTGGDTI